MKDGVALRAATPADVPSLAGVQLDSALAGFSHIFPESIPKPDLPDLEDEWGALVADPDLRVHVAMAGDTVAAAVAYGADPEPQLAADSVLLKLYVLPDHMGSGIGSALHDHATEDLAALGFAKARLWVLERNLVARRMYERRGWRLQPWFRSDWPGSAILEVGYTLELSRSI